MTVGTHTWSHKDLAKNPYASDLEQAKQEIEMGDSAVHMAAAGGRSRRSSASPICNIRRSSLLISAKRNIAIFSTDIDSFDFKLQQAGPGDQIGDDQAGEDAARASS